MFTKVSYLRLSDGRIVVIPYEDIAEGEEVEED